MKRLLILISILMAVGLAAPKAQFQTPRPGSGGGSGTPTAHATSHQNGGTDEINVGGLSGTLADPQTPAAHKTAHENGGADEISVAGLSGLLADLQNAIAHALSHQNGGGDEISHLSERFNEMAARRTPSRTRAGTRPSGPTRWRSPTSTPARHAPTSCSGCSTGWAQGPARPSRAATSMRLSRRCRAR